MKYSFMIEPGHTVKLKDYDPDFNAGLKKEEVAAKLEKLGEELSELQYLMYAAADTSLLIVLQGRDTSGKDGTIRHLTSHMNAQSCRVASFKQPTSEELGHDFLWRIHKETPIKGSITIFNRSHYEDVLVVKVHKLAPEKIIERRYDNINNFEESLIDAGTCIIKFNLHISKDEQKARLLDREKESVKSWKLSVADWKERELWDQYTEAYEKALEKCSTKNALWYVIPANHKWFRDLAITEVVVERLRPYRDRWQEDLKKRGVIALKELQTYRDSLKAGGKSTSEEA